MEPKILVDFSTDKARLKISEPELELTQLKGDFRFDSAKGLSGKGISARAFDRPITAQIFADGKPGRISTRVVASGQVGVKKLTDWLKFNQPIPISGDLPYQLQLTLDGADSQLRVSSSLKGAVVDLPAPFGLAANESRNSVFRMTLQGAERRYWFDYGDLANLTFAAPDGKFEDGRGELFLGSGAPVLPTTKGLRIRGVLSELDVAPWQALVERYAGNDPGGSAKQLLSSADFKVGKLIAFGTQLDQVRLVMKRVAASWALQIDSKQAIGAVTLPDAKNAPIVVNMQTIRLPAPDPKVVADDNAPDPLAAVDPRKIPALDIIIRQLYQGSELLGAWSLNIRPNSRGISLTSLNLGLKGMLLEGSGGWEGVAGNSKSWYQGRLGGGNLATVLKNWGFAPASPATTFMWTSMATGPVRQLGLASSVSPAHWTPRSTRGSLWKSTAAPGAAHFWLAQLQRHWPSPAPGLLRPVRQGPELRPGQGRAQCPQRRVQHRQADPDDRAVHQSGT